MKESISNANLLDCTDTEFDNYSNSFKFMCCYSHKMTHKSTVSCVLMSSNSLYPSLKARNRILYK